MRPSWDQYFLEIAKVISNRSTCLRAKHGSVIIDKQKRILSTGYNEAPAKLPGCGEAGCALVYRPNYGASCHRCYHAEENAIIYLISLQNHVLADSIYVTGTPCDQCLERICRVGIKRVVCAAKYNDKPSSYRDEMLSVFGVKIEYYEIF